MLTFDFDRLGPLRGDVLVDLGCGAGRHTFEALRRGAHVLSVDLDRKALAEVAVMAGAMKLEGEVDEEVRWQGVVGDALHLPLPDESVGHVIVSEVFEHIVEDTHAMKELHRVVKPGGLVAVSVPRWWPELICWALSSEYRHKPGGHVRIYRASQLLERLTGAGFAVEGEDHAHALHSPYWWLRCLFGVDDERAKIPRLYHGFLVWEMTNGGRKTRAIERALDPILGKSLVLYLTKAKVPAHV